MVRIFRCRADDIDNLIWIYNVVMPMSEYQTFLAAEMTPTNNHRCRLFAAYLACGFQWGSTGGLIRISPDEAVEFLRIATFEHSRFLISCETSTEKAGRADIESKVGIMAVQGYANASAVSAHMLLGWRKVDHVLIHITFAFLATSHSNATEIIASGGMIPGCDDSGRYLIYCSCNDPSWAAR